MSAEHAGEPDKNGMFSVFTKTMKIAFIEKMIKPME